MKVSKLKSRTPKVLQPKNIEDVAQFIQTQLESAEINEIGSVKVMNNSIYVLCNIKLLKNSGFSIFLTVCFG